MARYRRSSRGFSRQVRRKFVWDRTFGAVPTTSYGVDLLAPFRSQPGATHLGATVTRIRGYIYPDSVSDIQIGTVGFRIDSWNEDPAEPLNQPTNQPDEDWLAWLPYNKPPGVPEVAATWNQQASLWAVDIKAQRKLEELNQTLWMFVTQAAGNEANYSYNLSIGLKLP